MIDSKTIYARRDWLNPELGMDSSISAIIERWNDETISASLTLRGCSTTVTIELSPGFYGVETPEQRLAEIGRVRDKIRLIHSVVYDLMVALNKELDNIPIQKEKDNDGNENTSAEDVSGE